MTTPFGKTQNADYPNAKPIAKNIAKVNDMYNSGHQITMWTARGTVTGIDWYQLTLTQLQSWGVKFHNLKMGKPAFDLFIDDKVLNTRRWENEDIDTINNIIYK